MQSNRREDDAFDAVARLIVKKYEDSKTRFDADVVTWTYNDLVFLHSIGAADWQLAGLLMFHRMIDWHGSQEEKERLAAMNAGYALGSPDELVCSESDYQFLRAVGI